MAARVARKRNDKLGSIAGEGFYEKLFHSTALASIVVDKEGRIEYANKAFESLSRYSLDGLLALKRKWTDFLVADEIEGSSVSRNSTQGLNLSPDAAGSRCSFVDKAGMLQNVYVFIAAVAGTERFLITFTKAFQSQFEREELGPRRDKYRSLVESIDDSIYMLDRDCRYLFVNGRVLARLSIGEEGIIGKCYGDFHDVNDTREFTSYVTKVFETGSSYRYEYRGRKEERYTLRTISPVIEQTTRQVKYVVVVSKDITDLKKTEEKLKYLSLHDSLTGLYNRAYFEEEMHRLDSSRFELVSIIVCDIDGLKLINDTLGHKMGDELLITASRVIKASFRESDVVARVGGDEFAVLLPNSPRPIAEEICQRIREAVKEYNRKQVQLPLSIAIGFAVRTDSNQSMSELYREADNSMYREKLYSSQSVRNAIIKSLINTVETKGVVNHSSVKRFRKLTVALAHAIGMPEERIKNVHLLAQFHDIGNISIQDKILAKPGQLNNEEIVEIQKHSDIGHRIAQSAPNLAHISDFILKHHEWWNGKGYPLGLKGEEIPLESRIVAIADAYEAMTSGRPHRPAMSKNEALEELKRCAGTQFDPDLVEKFIELVGE